MKYTRTVKVPIHYDITTSKQSKLNKLTARLSYATKLFSTAIEKNQQFTRTALTPYERSISETTKLSSAYIQQCKDKSIWLWKSYNQQHKLWERKLSNAKKDTKWYKKLKKREPSRPFAKSNNKIPVRLDYRTATLKTNIPLKGLMVKPLKEEVSLSPLWLYISTLKKYDRIMLPLNPSNYHLSNLSKAIRIIDCEVVKKSKKWYVHFTCEYEVVKQSFSQLRAIDLGVNRSISTVLINPDHSLIYERCIKENEKKRILQRYDEYIARLQQLQKWKRLKHIRQRRKHFLEDSERKLAEAISVNSQKMYVAVGYPKGLKYNSFKGNGNRSLRRKLHKWSYSRIINYIKQSCEEKGICCTDVNEAWTSKTCSRCKSRESERPYRNTYSLFKCNSCNIILNADVNAAVNIGLRLVESQSLFNQWVVDEPAISADDFLHPGMSA